MRSGDSALNPRQPAHVTNGVVWIEGSDAPIMLRRTNPDEPIAVELAEPESGRSNLTLTPSTNHGTGQEYFLSWRTHSVLKGHFLTPDLLELLGEEVEITPSSDIVSGTEQNRFYAVASLPDIDQDRLLVAWIYDGCPDCGSSDTRLLAWRLVGRNDPMIYTHFPPDFWDEGSTRGRSGGIQVMKWTSGGIPQELSAWGNYCKSVDIASGSDHFMLIFVCGQNGSPDSFRVIASRIDTESGRVWQFDPDPSEPTLGEIADRVDRFHEVIVAGRLSGTRDTDRPELFLREEAFNQGWIYGQAAVAYDSNRDQYLVVYSRRDSENSRWDIIGRYLSPDGVLGWPFSWGGGATLDGEPEDEAMPSILIHRDLNSSGGLNPLMVKYAPEWDRYAVVFASGDSSSYELNVVELSGNGAILDGPTRVPMDGTFVYGDLKANGPCFSMAYEEGGIPGGGKEIRRSRWCE